MKKIIANSSRIKNMYWNQLVSRLFPTKFQRLQKRLSTFGLDLDLKTGLLSYLPNFKSIRLNCDIVCFRHGETNANKELRFQGQSNRVGWNDLNLKGQKDAIKTGKTLKQFIKQNQWDPDMILTSPLKRARETCQIAVHCVDQVLPKPRIYSKLKEISFGRWENKAESEMTPSELIGVKNYRQKQQAIAKDQYGECFAELVLRVRKTLLNLSKKYPNKKIVIFGHGAWIQAARVLVGMPVEADRTLSWRNHNPIQNGQIYRIKRS